MQTAIEPGAIIDDRYRVDTRLGEGGFGTVWAAERLDRPGRVAVKVLKAHDPTAIRRFAREVMALARLEHTNCLRLLDSGQLSDGTPYLVTDYVDGLTLRQWLKSPRSTDELLRVARQVAAALEHAHQLGISHRDLKPDNVMILDAAGGAKVKVLDFGLSKLTGARQSDVTKTGEIVGTPGFMSPEQLRGWEIGPPSDVYSLGVMFFEMFEGRPPFSGQTVLEVAMKHLTEIAPRAAAGGRSEIAHIIERMLDKDPRKRPAIAGVIQVLRGEPNAQRIPAAPESRPRPNRRIYVLGLLGFASVAALLWAFSTPGPPEDASPGHRPRHGSSEALLKIVGQPDKPPNSKPAVVEDLRPARGCGREIGAGIHYFEETRALQDIRVAVRIPASYDTNKPAPVLVMVHDVAQTPRDLFDIESIARLAERDGFVTIAPRDPGMTNVWLSPSDYQRVVEEVALAATELCLDTERIFLFGHGNGGVVTDQISCMLDGVRAVATSSHRLWSSRSTCSDESRVPLLFISPLEDGFAPVDGGLDCLLSTKKWSLGKHEQMLFESHGCRGKSKETYSGAHGRCETFACDTALTRCRVQGGRYWSEMPQSRTAGVGACIGTPVDFPYAERIWEFFAAHDVPKE